MFEATDVSLADIFFYLSKWILVILLSYYLNNLSIDSPIWGRIWTFVWHICLLLKFNFYIRQKSFVTIFISGLNLLLLCISLLSLSLSHIVSRKITYSCKLTPENIQKVRLTAVYPKWQGQGCEAVKTYWLQ